MTKGSFVMVPYHARPLPLLAVVFPSFLASLQFPSFQDHDKHPLDHIFLWLPWDIVVVSHQTDDARLRRPVNLVAIVLGRRNCPIDSGSRSSESNVHDFVEFWRHLVARLGADNTEMPMYSRSIAYTWDIPPAIAIAAVFPNPHPSPSFLRHDEFLAVLVVTALVLVVDVVVTVAVLQLLVSEVWTSWGVMCNVLVEFVLPTKFDAWKHRDVACWKELYGTGLEGVETMTWFHQLFLPRLAVVHDGITTRNRCQSSLPAFVSALPIAIPKCYF